MRDKEVKLRQGRSHIDSAGLIHAPTAGRAALAMLGTVLVYCAFAKLIRILGTLSDQLGETRAHLAARADRETQALNTVALVAADRVAQQRRRRRGHG